MAQLTTTKGSTADAKLSPDQQLCAVVTPHLLEQLRNVFEAYELQLVEKGEAVAICSDLRRSRRVFIDGFVRQWTMCCSGDDSGLSIGSMANASHTRTFIYFSQADTVIRSLYQEQAESIGRLSAAWTHYVGQQVDPLTCPLAPHILGRLFFLFLPELRAPMRVRHGLAQRFIQQLPLINLGLQNAAFTFLQRIGLSVNTLTPHALPEWWAPLEQYKTPSVAAQALVAPARTLERVESIADEIARAALASDTDDVLSIVSTYRQTAVLPWLAEHLSSGMLSASACEVLSLLAGPLVVASTDEHFADAAHPVRKVLEEWMQWAPGWGASAWADGVIAQGVTDQCLRLARQLASQLVQSGHGESATHNPADWLELLDLLLGLRKRSQQEGSVAVASTRLSVQVLEVRAEVEAFLLNRAGPYGLPRVAVEILSDIWVTLLMSIHWREGTASDDWLSAIAVADELLVSVQPELDRATRMHAMQRVPQLLQQLRKGFDTVNIDRQVYSAYLDRLEQVHLALIQGKPSPEESVYWPEAIVLPTRDEPFLPGQWLQEEDGARWRVIFSDDLCTVLIDTDTTGLMCCATASLQAQFFNAALRLLPAPRPLLPLTLS